MIDMTCEVNDCRSLHCRTGYSKVRSLYCTPLRSLVSRRLGRRGISPSGEIKEGLSTSKSKKNVWTPLPLKYQKVSLGRSPTVKLSDLPKGVGLVFRQNDSE